MSQGPSEPSLPLSLGQRPGLSYDSRTGLGYGLAKDSFHKQRPEAGSFPYKEGSKDLEDLEKLDMDIDILQKIYNKVSTPFKSSDSLIGRSADHLAKVNGNAPVAIGEAVAKGLVPFPAMYKKRTQVGGGVNSPKTIRPGQYNLTGTKRGWSQAPAQSAMDLSYEENNSGDPALEKVRNIVRLILKNSSEEI